MFEKLLTRPSFCGFMYIDETYRQDPRQARHHPPLHHRHPPRLLAPAPHPPSLVGGGEKGYQFGGRDGARCGVTFWPAVGAGMEEERLLSSLSSDCPRF